VLVFGLLELIFKLVNLFVLSLLLSSKYLILNLLDLELELVDVVLAH
jgi:hypothetical protein